MIHAYAMFKEAEANARHEVQALGYLTEDTCAELQVTMQNWEVVK